MRSRRKKIIIIGMILLAAAIIAVLFGWAIWKKQQMEKAASTSNEVKSDYYVTYNGKKYEYNHDLKNILFMGVDKQDAIAEQSVGNGGQSDTLILLSTNKEDKTTTLLEISRDAMTDIKIYDMNGKYLSTERAQIALQYAYGDGVKKSALLTKEAVSNLLYEIPISAYLVMGVEGIGTITDAVGGVQITVPEDYTAINPLFQKGAKLTLNGEQAEQYVRSRDVEATGSNNQRMERQKQFLQAMAVQFQGRDMNWYNQVFQQAEDYIVTDASMKELERLSEYSMKETIEVVPGSVQAGEEHDEFVVDNEKLQELIIKLFYKEVE